MLWRSLLVLSLLAAWPLFALAQGPEPNRVLRLIDFEERKLGNNEDLPMHWDKISGPGLPHYVNGYLSDDLAHGGQYSFRFDLNGGSLVYRYDPHQLPVTAGARYHVEVYCHTSALQNARARLTVYFTDADGNPLPDAVQRSELYVTPQAGPAWKKLTVELNADEPKAAFLAVELALLQPAMYADRALGDRTLLPQDINGSAWFDDVLVAQVPEVSLASGRPGNLFRLGDNAKLSLDVNDLFTDDLQSKLSVTDGAGSQVYQRTGSVDVAAGGTTAHERVTVALPKLPAGWYRARLDMTSHGRSLGLHTMDFIQLADSAQPAPPDSRFGVIATDLLPRELDQLPVILPWLSVGRAKVAVWSDQGEDADVTPPSADEASPAGQAAAAQAQSAATAQSQALDTVLEKLESEGITPTGCLVSIPHSLSHQLGGSSWIKLLQANPQDWQPQISYLISRHADHLDQWQLGSDFSDEFVNDIRMREVYKLVYGQFSQLVHNPDLAMPWPAWNDIGQPTAATVALSIPAEVLPERIPLYLRDLIKQSTPQTHNFSIALQWLDDRYGRDVRLRDLTVRMIFALAGGAKRIDFALPFTMRIVDGQVTCDPKEEFIIERTLMRVLGGANYKGAAPLADGVQTMLFDRYGEGVLAVWSRGARGTRSLELSLGHQPLLVDMWGNVTPLKLVDGKVKLDVGPMPVLIVGIDSLAAQIRAGIAFDQALVESSFQSHTRQLIFTNPSDHILNGTVRLRPPAGWTMNPDTFEFTLPAHQPFQRQITIDFPYNSLAAPKKVSADFSLEGDDAEDFSVPLELTLGLSDVGMQSSALRDGSDLLVQEMVTNYGEAPVDYTAYASYPGQTRQERLVQSLDPGRTTIKLYRFRNVKFMSKALRSVAACGSLKGRAC
jgi:hypothetical protein